MERFRRDRHANPDVAKQIQEEVLSEPGFPAQLVGTVLELSSEGIDEPIFFFERDRSTHEPHVMFRFFVVGFVGGRNRIVRDEVSFSATPDGRFDAAVFEPAFREDGIPTPINQTLVRSRYREFYEDTDSGRLTTLRDVVPLYHFVPAWKAQARIAAELKLIRWLVNACLVVLVLSLLHVL